jgi:hypothetical protein
MSAKVGIGVGIGLLVFNFYKRIDFLSSKFFYKTPCLLCASFVSLCGTTGYYTERHRGDTELHKVRGMGVTFWLYFDEHLKIKKQTELQQSCNIPLVKISPTLHPCHTTN